MVTAPSPPPDLPGAVQVPGGPLLVDGPVDAVLPDGTAVRSDRFVVAICTCRRSSAIQCATPVTGAGYVIRTVADAARVMSQVDARCSASHCSSSSVARTPRTWRTCRARVRSSPYAVSIRAKPLAARFRSRSEH